MLPTIHASADLIRRRLLQPLDLLNGCLARIDKLESKVHAWVSVARDSARADACRLTDELKQGRYRGPLHGIPIAIKDIFDVHDWPTAAGSKLWAAAIARRDCTVVRKLRQAGAVLIGKTVTTQYASFDPPVTRNPWDTARTPGGSSSGSAAALACGMCVAALGSQTGGSITRPAAYCGVTGLKPTWGRVSTTGVVPLAPSMDHPGPMATCVRDLAILLQVIAGADPTDPDCSLRAVPDYSATLTSKKPPRLGRLHGLFEERADPVVRSMMDQTTETLRQHGAAIIDVALPAEFAEVIARHRVIMAVEALAFHSERLERHADDYSPKIRGLLEEAKACPAHEYALCKDHQRNLSRDILACFDGVDALLTPATTTPPPAADTTGDPAFNSPWSYTGLPTVSLPSGWTPEGLPLAIQLAGSHWSEAQLLSVAAWCESILAFESREPQP
jgi:aspartyl-tRNA(Asn)/glutamyl-tRNA(Gln) amidotransferase subunit A